MGGLHSCSFEGRQVKYKDLFLVEVFQFGERKKISCEFLELSDDGDYWFRCLAEDDHVRGDDTFPSYYQEVGNIEYVGSPDRPDMFLGSGI